MLNPRRSDMLPEFADPQLHAELARAGIHNLKPVAPLCMGTSNQNFLATAGGDSWVLRVNSRQTEEFCPREREVLAWRLAEAAGLAPELRFVSTDYRYYLSRYVHSPEPWHKHYRENPRAVRQLHELLTGLRHLPTTARVITPESQWQQYQQQVDQQRADYTRGQCAGLEALRLREDKILTAITQLQEDQALTFCHRDLNPHNLLLAGEKLLCVDFEYSCVSDVRVELAALLACHHLTRDQSRRLLQLQSLTPSNPQLAAATRVYWGYAAIWSLIMWHKGIGTGNWLSDALTLLDQS